MIETPVRVDVMGAPVDVLTMGQTVELAAQYAEADKFAHFIGVNADKLLQMRDDQEMDSIVRRCEVVNADGASMVMAAHYLGIDLPERVAGIDLMYELCAMAANRGIGVFLLGAKQEVVENTSRKLRELYPTLSIVGCRNGYFQESDFDKVTCEVAKSGARIVFVGITSPKKEQVIERFRAKGLKGVFVGVGGSFDVVSGNIPRAPLWMQKAKLEWMFRMLQEPGRLVKRYAMGNTRFLLLLLKEKLSKRKGAS